MLANMLANMLASFRPLKARKLAYSRVYHKTKKDLMFGGLDSKVAAERAAQKARDFIDGKI